MLLQYEDQAGFDTAYRVDLCAEFEDAFKFGSFVEKLTRLAGYHHVQPPDRDLSPNTTSDYENEDDMNESDIRENSLNQHQISESRSEKEMDRPLIKFTEECALRYTFAQSHFEVYHPETGTTWRFLHAAIRQRGYKLNPRGRAPRADRSRFFLFNVTLQARKTAVRARRAAQYVDVGPCDVEFDRKLIDRIYSHQRALSLSTKDRLKPYAPEQSEFPMMATDSSPSHLQNPLVPYLSTTMQAKYLRRQQAPLFHVQHHPELADRNGANVLGGSDRLSVRQRTKSEDERNAADHEESSTLTSGNPDH
ncbi:unnamed protein product, partial [Mesorhabditis belari]|uniref:Uncharacterized protein n=1 Tax=Mesorhabditis belari TaxID=2138241 RepID=A0AAF3J654_9BILA